eukprot:Skav227701  [mRNA]  locus=scaffold1635:78713:83912:+ [translate_table: standard]
MPWIQHGPTPTIPAIQCQVTGDPLAPGASGDARDANFLRRLRNLASEALTWPHLGGRQRLLWLAAAELEAVPVQELRWSHDGTGMGTASGGTRGKGWGARDPSSADDNGSDPPLRQCQLDCLAACAQGARVIEMACGSGKTRVIKELVSNTSGRVLITVPLRALLDQFAPDFPGFCKVGMGHNKNINLDARGFIAVTDSVHLLKKVKFDSIFVDEGHHPLPTKLPKTAELYQFSATHKHEPEFRYTMGEAIEDGVLCDYDITVPALTAHHAYVCLADLLVKQAGHFRRVLAYCNSVSAAKRFRMVLRELGLAAWHINGKTPLKKRTAAIEEFAGALQKPVHVLVTVEVLGEGINIPNADTCMFVEPRQSYRSIIQAIGRVLRHHPAKTLAHIVLPAVAIPNSRVLSMSSTEGGGNVSEEEGEQNAGEIANSGFVSKSGIESRGETFEQARQQNAEENFDLGRVTCEKLLETHGESPGDMIQVQGHQLQEQNKMRTNARTDHSRINPKSEFQVEKARGSSGLNSDVVSNLETFRSSSPVPHTIALGSKNGRARTDGQHCGGSHTKPDALAAELHEMRKDESNSGALGVSHAQGHLGAVARTEGSDISPGTSPTAPMFDKGGHLQGEVPKQMEGQGEVETVGFEEKFSNSQRLEPLSSSSFEPDSPKWLSHLHPFPAWTSTNQVGEEGPSGIISLNGRPKFRRSLKMKEPSGWLAFGQGFGSQLERFLATLMQADHRLVGATAGHRIQIEDCTLIDSGATAMEVSMAQIYGQLSAILTQEDPWEVRLRNVEAFVNKHGKLPLRAAADYNERTLGIWLQNQGLNFGSQRMPVHRFHQLLASLPLIRRRAERWQAGGDDGRFKQNCRILKEHLQLHGSLPKQSVSSSHRLARWLSNVQRRPLRPYHKKMLKDVHPLVKAEVEKWQNEKLRVERPRWERRLGELSEFVSGTRRVPRQTGGAFERRCYSWLSRQSQSLRTGILPSDLAQRLREAHPLIAAYFNTASQAPTTSQSAA